MLTPQQRAFLIGVGRDVARRMSSAEIAYVLARLVAVENNYDYSDSQWEAAEVLADTICAIRPEAAELAARL